MHSHIGLSRYTDNHPSESVLHFDSLHCVDGVDDEPTVSHLPFSIVRCPVNQNLSS